MKSNYFFRKVGSFWIGMVSLILMTANNLKAESEKGNTSFSNVKLEDIVASVQAGKLNSFEKTSDAVAADRQLLGVELIRLFENTNSSNFSKCCAVYYLGEFRFQAAKDMLATNIALHLDTSRFTIDHRPIMAGDAVVDALIKIGTPAIPAIIRNLAESDDAKVRELSLKVLNQIEGDKDIVQLRLQKALTAEKDPQKQARLQTALDGFKR